MQTTIDLLTALTAMLAAIGGVLAVVLVQGRKAHAYALGDQVTYGGQVWRSTVGANVWTPGVYGLELIE